MALRLKYRQGTFHLIMWFFLSIIKGQFAPVYLDDFVIFSMSFEEHLDHIQTLLLLLRRAGVSLNLINWLFLEGRIKYFGHVIRRGRIVIWKKWLMGSAFLNALRIWLSSSCLWVLAPNFEDLYHVSHAKPYRWVKRGERTILSDENDWTRTKLVRAEILQHRLQSPPTLELPRLGRRYNPNHDSFDKQSACHLLGEQPKAWPKTVATSHCR